MKRIALIVTVAGILVMTLWLLLEFTGGSTLRKMKAATFVQQFEKNEEQAMKKYGGKRVQIQGNMESLQNNDGRYQLVMTGTTGHSIMADGTSDHLPFLPQVGDTIVIEGTCSGMLLDVILNDCILLTQ